MQVKMRESGNQATDVQSAGIAALIGQHADEKAQMLLLDKGIDSSQHVARQLSGVLVNWAELILVMEQSHLDEIQQHYPTARGKVFLLGHWSGLEIKDPYMKEFTVFQTVFEQIDTAVEEWTEKILNN